MNDPTLGDTAWHRRDRSFDWMGAVALTAAGALGHLSRGGHEAWSLALALVGLVGLACLFADRESWLEKHDGKLRWVEELWWFGVRRRGATALEPERVVLAPAKRGLALSIEADGRSLELERYREGTQEMFARVSARRLARWLELPLFDAATRTTWRAARELETSELLSSLRTLASEASGSSARIFRGSRLPLRLAGALQVLAGGGLLVDAGRTSPSVTPAWLALLGLPLGALLAVEGLRVALLGAIVTRITPSALHVEREGLARELIAHVSFGEVRSLSAAPRSAWRSEAVRIDLGGETLRLSRRTLGLTPADFERFRRALRDAATTWLRTRFPAANDTLEVREPLPNAASNMDPWDDRSGLARLGRRFPRLALATASAFVALALFLQRGLTAALDDAPRWVRLEGPSLSGYAFWVMLAVAGVLVALAPLLAAMRIIRAAPAVPGFHAVLFLLWIPIAVPVVQALTSAQKVGESANICLGDVARPLHGELLDEGDAMRFSDEAGRVEIHRAIVRRGLTYRSGILHLSESPDELVEIDGKFGGRYVVRSRELPEACDVWRAIR